MALSKKDRALFDEIKAAAQADQLLLMECEEIGTHKKVATICSHHMDGGVHCFTPLARLFAGDPYNQIAPPGAKAPRLI